MKIYANLHNHTTHSDGIFTPTELVRVAKEEGYKAIVAADHDTVTAYDEMKAACEKEGLETIFGCEFYALCPQYEKYFLDYHLVGFHFDPNYPAMKEYLKKRSDDMAEKTEHLFNLAQKEGKISKEITWQEVCDYNKGITWLCNDHVREAMKAKGLVTDSEWHDIFMNAFAASYARKIGVFSQYPIMEIPDLISLIHDAGGIAVVAHPYDSVQPRTIPQLVKWGLDGVEVWHNGIVRKGYQKEMLRLALEHGLYISGGEDHSGLCGGQYKFYEKPEETRFWVDPCTLGTTKEFFEEIRDRRFNPKREEYIKEYMAQYNDAVIPDFED